jgi:hypothetical protein
VEHDDVEPKDEDEVTSEVERFANDFFTYLEQKNQCPKLRAVIFGMHWDPKIPHDLVQGDESLYSRHCFVKEHQSDASNLRMAVAVPVPAYKIRELEPECDLLDLDPECEWVGGIPGRLYEF